MIRMSICEDARIMSEDSTRPRVFECYSTDDFNRLKTQKPFGELVPGDTAVIITAAITVKIFNGTSWIQEIGGNSMTEGLLLKVLSGAGGSSGGSDIDVTDFASQDDITSIWTALGDLTNVVDAIVDKLSTNTAVAATLSDDTVADEPGLTD